MHVFLLIVLKAWPVFPFDHTIHQFVVYILSNESMPDPLLEPGDTTDNHTGKIPAPREVSTLRLKIGNNKPSNNYSCDK